MAGALPAARGACTGALLARLGVAQTASSADKGRDRRIVGRHYGAPWADETLDATWSIEPAQGRPFDVVSNAPLYGGPLGVQLDFAVNRAPNGVYVVSGTAGTDVDSGHVELWAYAPGANRARRVARVAVHAATWAYTRFAPGRRGKWELYARYRSARKAFADDTSECGTIVSVK